LQVDFEKDPLWFVANIYPATPDGIGAPKWGKHLDAGHVGLLGRPSLLQEAQDGTQFGCGVSREESFRVTDILAPDCVNRFPALVRQFDENAAAIVGVSVPSGVSGVFYPVEGRSHGPPGQTAALPISPTATHPRWDQAALMHHKARELRWRNAHN
jgi:hypothetical protein